METKKKPLLRTAHRQKKHEGMVHKILETARAIMREQGVAALSMQEIARRINLRAPSLYNYFNSKMDIYDALFRMGFRLYADHWNACCLESNSWQEYTQQAFACYLSFAKANPDLYQLCFERPVPGFVPSPESMQTSWDLLNQAYSQIGRFHESLDTNLPPQQCVDLLIAMMHGITAMHMSNEPELPAGEGRFGGLIPAAIEVFGKAWSRA